MCEEARSVARSQQVVTIDGPSGVGKSTISRTVAAALEYTYLDTGAMYRAVAFRLGQVGIDPEQVDEEHLLPLLDNIDIQLLPPLEVGGEVQVFLAGEDISREIRLPEMSMLASAASAIPAVRTRLTAMQQEITFG